MNMNYYLKKLRAGIYKGVIRGRGIRFIQLINEEKISCWRLFFPLFCTSSSPDCFLVYVCGLFSMLLLGCRIPFHRAQIGDPFGYCHEVASNSPVLHFVS
jgi:hypothetical protein